MFAGTLMVAVGVVAVAGVALTTSDSGAAAPVDTSADTSTEPGTAPDWHLDRDGERRVVRDRRREPWHLDSEEDFSGSMGFGDGWTLPLQLDGIITAGSPFGTVVPFGSALVTVDNEQVYLAEGGMPMYRDLRLESPRLEGYDVAQLQLFLITLGFDDDGAMTADGVFGTTTRNAVRDWQDSRGVDDTGVVSRQELVFNPTPLRVASDRDRDDLRIARRDGARRRGTVDASSDDRAWLAEGTAVTVELADGSSVAGTVTEQLAVSTDDGSTAYRSTIALDGEVSTDAPNVRIVVSTTVADDVLIVPVAALLAPAEGGYAVEIVDGVVDPARAVDVGAILDGRAEIIGDVAEGDTVVVAG